MNRKLLGWISVPALLLLGCAGFWTLYGTHEIALTQAQIQSRLDKQMGKDLPLKGAAQTLVKSVQAKNGAVQIGADQVTISFDIEGVLRNGKTFSVSATSVGAPQYVSGEFYFEPSKVEIENFTYENSRPADIASRLGKFLGEGAAKRVIEGQAQRAEDWVTTLAENTVKHALEERPVYVLKDDTKGQVLKSSLESMKVENGRVVLTFSLWRLTTSAALGALGWIAAIWIALLLLRSSLVPDLGDIVD